MKQQAPLRDFDATSLKTRVAALPPALRVAYALLIAERLYPALVAYSRETHGQDASQVRRYLDEVWDGLGRGTLDVARLREIAAVVFELRPETEDNPSPISSYALDATAAAWEALQAAITGDPSHVVAAAQIAFDSVYLSEEEREGSDQQHPIDQGTVLSRELVVRELDTQDFLLGRARELSRTPQEGVSVLRREFGRPEQSIHGLS